MEQVIGDCLSDMLSHKLEPLQFPFKAKCGIEDACLTLLDSPNNWTLHIPAPEFYSWTFSLPLIPYTHTHTHTLQHHLSHLQVLILWIQSFLHNRPQQVYLNSFKPSMALVAHLPNSAALTRYQQTVNNHAQVFQNNFLELKIPKTKELCCGGRGKSKSLTPLSTPLSI